MGPLLRLLTRDPASGSELVVTRLEAPASGVVIEGTFSLGWIGRLAPDQLDFVGRFIANRGNLQKLAAELGMSYNTARSRLDDVVTALGGTPEPPPERNRTEMLERLKSGEISFEQAMDALRAPGG
jgi:hypothetical protein